MSSGILQITGVQESDAGLYRCYAAQGSVHELPGDVSDINGKYSAEALLTVKPGEVEFFLPNSFPNKALFFKCLQKKSFENTVEKGEIARKGAISPSLHRLPCQPFLRTFCHFHQIYNFLSANSFSLEESKYL